MFRGFIDYFSSSIFSFHLASRADFFVFLFFLVDELRQWFFFSSFGKSHIWKSSVYWTFYFSILSLFFCLINTNRFGWKNLRKRSEKTKSFFTTCYESWSYCRWTISRKLIKSRRMQCYAFVKSRSNGKPLKIEYWYRLFLDGRKIFRIFSLEYKCLQCIFTKYFFILKTEMLIQRNTSHTNHTAIYQIIIDNKVFSPSRC